MLHYLHLLVEKWLELCYIVHFKMKSTRSRCDKVLIVAWLVFYFIFILSLHATMSVDGNMRGIRTLTSLRTAFRRCLDTYFFGF